MTRGVCGIWYCFEEAMARCQQCGKEGSGDDRMSPVRDALALAPKYARFSRKECRSVCKGTIGVLRGGRECGRGVVGKEG